MRLQEDLIIVAAEAQHLEKLGRFEDAIDTLGDVWNKRRELLDIGETDEEIAAHLALRCGSLISAFGHSNQIPDSQEESKDLLTFARQIFLQLENWHKVAECEYSLAMSYWRLGESEEANTWADQALGQPISEDSIEGLYAILVKGIALDNAKKYQEAASFLGGYHSHFEQCEDLPLKGSYFSNVGLVLKSLGRVNEALDHLKVARRCHKESGHRIYRGTVENNLAQIFRVEGRFEDAHKHVDDAISFYDETRDMARKGSSLDTKAQIFFDEGKYNKALIEANKAIDILKDGENRVFLIEAYFTRSKILVFLDDVAPATLSLFKAIEIARKTAGEKVAEKLAKEFEIVVRKKSVPIESDGNPENLIYQGSLELVIPPSLANYTDYQVVRIKNSHLEEIGIPMNSLAIVVDDTIKRGDLVALSEIANETVICGFYDYFAGIVSVSGMNSNTLLFKTEEVKVVGKIIGVGNPKPAADGKIRIEPVTV